MKEVCYPYVIYPSIQTNIHHLKDWKTISAGVEFVTSKYKNKRRSHRRWYGYIFILRTRGHYTHLDVLVLYILFTCTREGKKNMMMLLSKQFWSQWVWSLLGIRLVSFECNYQWLLYLTIFPSQNGSGWKGRKGSAVQDFHWFLFHFVMLVVCSHQDICIWNEICVGETAIW